MESLEQLTMVSAKLPRELPTSPWVNEMAAAPSRGDGYCCVPEELGSPEGITLVHVPALTSRTAYIHLLSFLISFAKKESRNIPLRHG